MGTRPIQAISFDLWDCLFHDDSDEIARQAAGRPSKAVERRQLMHAALARHAPVAREVVDAAYDAIDAAFRKVWHEQHLTWTVAERLQLVLQSLGGRLPDAEFEALVHAHETMELEFRPQPAQGAVEALQALHGHYPLAIVSDAIFTPGKHLRELLRGAGMLGYFDHFVFSDELGRSKPHRALFDSVARRFGVALEGIVHIGDRPHNDVGGPHAVGARAVLLTAVKQRPLDGHRPDAVCERYADLPGVLRAMA